MFAGNFRPIVSTSECEINLARRELRIAGSQQALSALDAAGRGGARDMHLKARLAASSM